jgi:hypothetical protein
MADDRKPPKPKSLGQVGYGKPPKHTQFQKGKSGNPAGRPRKEKAAPMYLSAKEMRDMLRTAAQRKVLIKTNGRSESTTCIELGCRQAVASAAKGDLKALDFLMKALSVEDPKPKERRKLNVTLKLGDTVIEKEPFDAPTWFKVDEE